MKRNKISGQYKSEPVKKSWTLREFHERRNKVLIMRQSGGLGDIVMHRLFFEDFKTNSDTKVCFACPSEYHDAVRDHPFVDELLDSRTVDSSLYPVSYNTTEICGRTEQLAAPFPSDHRSDIWANWCGVPKSKREMYIQVSITERSEAREQIGPKSSVALCPLSAISSKNLDSKQMNGVAFALKEKGYHVFGLHHYPIPSLDAPTIVGKNIRNLFGLIAEADYIISVDSGPFHIAGGMGKPTVGIFSWACGDVYSKYYPNKIIVQRHRKNGNWDCGPCYLWGQCKKCPDPKQPRKPCITEITAEEIVLAFDQLVAKQPK